MRHNIFVIIETFDKSPVCSLAATPILHAIPRRIFQIVWWGRDNDAKALRWQSLHDFDAITTMDSSA